MNIRSIALDELILDPNLNLRDRLDEDTVDRYVDSWDRLPPITVFEVNGRLLVGDGFHRHAAAVKLGKRSIRAEIKEGTFTEALDYVAGANLFHGLPLSRAERRRAIEVKLRLHNDRSDRHLAEELAVSRDTIARIRKQLVESGQIPSLGTRIGSDGKVYPALPKDVGERRPTKGNAGEEPPAKGKGKGTAEWDDTTDPLPPVKGGPRGKATAPWEAETVDAKAIANAPPIEPSAPTIDEMLALMTSRVMEVVTWSQAERFAEAYRAASANARGLFQTAIIKLAARADQLRKLSAV